MKHYPEQYRFDLIVEYEQIPVRGNAMASGDDAADKAYEDEIIERLERGDVWAWAAVEVRCTHIPSGIHASDYLGGCSYRDEEDFKANGDYESMREDAYDECRAEIKRIKAAIDKAGV